MADKVLCPWCGAEMEIKTVRHDVPGIIYARGAKKRECRWNAWTSCSNNDCGADGPIVLELETEQEAQAEAVAAAMRRYNPPIKPMTMEEVDEHVRPNDANPLWIEDKTGCPSDEWILAGTVWQMCKIMRNRDEYGKTWRCWERKPTDEERSAAEWEISPE